MNVDCPDVKAGIGCYASSHDVDAKDSGGVRRRDYADDARADQRHEPARRSDWTWLGAVRRGRRAATQRFRIVTLIPYADTGRELVVQRSEERRVGKECRSRW